VNLLRLVYFFDDNNNASDLPAGECAYLTGMRGMQAFRFVRFYYRCFLKIISIRTISGFWKIQSCKITKPRIFSGFCAQDKTRTCTLLTAPAPQAGVSTNSTTWATIFGDLLICRFADFKINKSINQQITCAWNRTRTCTSLRTLVPETSASTNSAIQAFKKSIFIRA
jgi:hypothetical protein